jgi:hypothetical protein
MAVNGLSANELTASVPAVKVTRLPMLITQIPGGFFQERDRFIAPQQRVGGPDRIRGRPADGPHIR